MTRTRCSTPLLTIVTVLGVLLGATACSSDDESAAPTTEPVVVTTVATTVPVTTLAEGGLTLAADITSDLVDRQQVTVTGDGFDPSARVVQCSLDDLQVCWSGASADAGSFDGGVATIDVRRIIPGAPDIDCAEIAGSCVIRLALGADAELVAGAPLLGLTFDPDSPSTSTLDLTVTPDTGLVDGQEIAIEITNVPGAADLVEAVTIEVCAAGVAPWCLALPTDGAAVTDDSISLAWIATVVLVDPTGQSPDVDCVIASCVVAVSVPGSPAVEAALAFDDTQPVAEPSLELLPTDDPRTFQVVGAGLAPGSGLVIVACVEGQATCALQGDPVVIVDPVGSIDAVLTLPATADGLPCEPGTCAFSIASTDPVIYLEPTFVVAPT